MRHLKNITEENSAFIQRLLNIIADRKTSVSDYRASFYSIGEELGILAKGILPSDFKTTTFLACASEDADWLADGFMHGISEPMLPMAVFWGRREHLSNGVDITSIVKSFQDEAPTECKNLIIIKSIISSSCVVKTHILRLITTLSPSKIFIIAPVMYKDAEMNLRNDFPLNISEKFYFLTFAIDDEINENREIIPGVGGMVYPRLGLGGESDKNSYFPDIVKRRL